MSTIKDIDDEEYTKEKGGYDIKINEIVHKIDDMEEVFTIFDSLLKKGRLSYERGKKQYPRWINIRTKKETIESMIIIVFDVEVIGEILRRIPSDRNIKLLIDVRVPTTTEVIDEIIKKKPKKLKKENFTYRIVIQENFIQEEKNI